MESPIRNACTRRYSAATGCRCDSSAWSCKSTSQTSGMPLRVGPEFRPIVLARALHNLDKQEDVSVCWKLKNVVVLTQPQHGDIRLWLPVHVEFQRGRRRRARHHRRSGSSRSWYEGALGLRRSRPPRGVVDDPGCARARRGRACGRVGVNTSIRLGRSPSDTAFIPPARR